MTTSDKLREIAEKWARPINSPHDDEEATQEVLSDLTALISEHYVAKEEVDKMVSERLREELIEFDAWGYGSYTENKAIIDDVDEYLKSKEQ